VGDSQKRRIDLASGFDSAVRDPFQGRWNGVSITNKQI